MRVATLAELKAPTNREITITREWSEPIQVPLDYKLKWGRLSTVAYESMDQDGNVRTYPRVLLPLPPRKGNLTSVRFRVIDPDIATVEVKLEFVPISPPTHLPHRELPQFMNEVKQAEVPAKHEGAPSIGRGAFSHICENLV